MLLAPLRPLHDMSDLSGMDGGDPLGDRFWLSPKKGEWQGSVDSNAIPGKEAGCSERTVE